MKPEFTKDILVQEQRFGSRRHENGARMLVLMHQASAKSSYPSVSLFRSTSNIGELVVCFGTSRPP